MNIFGWIFLISLAIFVVGALGLYFNRSLTELKFRLKSRQGGDEDMPKHSQIEEWLLPKYNSMGRRFANRKFHRYVDANVNRKVARFFLLVLAIGAVIQIGLWVYVANFTGSEFSFLKSPR